MGLTLDRKVADDRAGETLKAALQLALFCPPFQPAALGACVASLAARRVVTSTAAGCSFGSWPSANALSGSFYDYGKTNQFI